MLYLRILIALVLTAAVLAKQENPDDFPMPPAWATKLVKQLKDDGFVIGYPDGMWCRGSRPASSYEFAVFSHAGYANLKAMLEKLESGKQVVTPSSYAELTKDAQASRDVIRLFDEFAVELDKLGADAPPITAEISSFPSRFDMGALSGLICLRLTPADGVPFIQSTGFADVPANHWAAQATSELKAAGILHGYPDGLFRG